MKVQVHTPKLEHDRGMARFTKRLSRYSNDAPVRSNTLTSSSSSYMAMAPLRGTALQSARDMQVQAEAALQLAEETRLVMVAKQRACEKLADDKAEKLAHENAIKAVKAHYNAVQRHVADGQCGEGVDAAKSQLRKLESWARGKEHLDSVRPGDTVVDLKLLIQEKDGVHMKHERVFFAGKQLENGRT